MGPLARSSLRSKSGPPTKDTPPRTSQRLSENHDTYLPLSGRFWVPKSMQQLESIDFKIDEKPVVLITYLRIWVAKRPQRKRSKTKPNTGDIIESLGGYFGSPWGHLGGRLVVLGAPLGVLGELLGITWGHLGHGRVDREVPRRAQLHRT